MSEETAPGEGAQPVESAPEIDLATAESARASAAGKVYQAIAQSAAIAVQDATDNLRNISTVSTTAAGIAISQLLATKDSKYAAVITQAQQMMSHAVTDYASICEAAAKTLRDFPSD